MQYLQAVENMDFESAKKYVSYNISYEEPEGLGSFNKAEPYLKIFRVSKFTKSRLQKEIRR